MYLHLKKQNKKQTIRSLCNMNCKYPWKYPCLFTLGVTCGWTIRPWGRPTGSALFQLQADHHSSRAHIPTLKWVFFHLGYTFHCARQYLNGSQATVHGIRFYWGKVMHDMKLYIYTWYEIEFICNEHDPNHRWSPLPQDPMIPMTSVFGAGATRHPRATRNALAPPTSCGVVRPEAEVYLMVTKDYQD